jgi:iron complex transport system substrate-binding protein
MAADGNLRDDGAVHKDTKGTKGIALACVLVFGFFLEAPAVSTQSRFVDDAGRDVALPEKVDRVFAAGGPAEVLLHTLAPEKLAGRNRVPEGAAVAFFPPAFRKPTLIRRLPELNDAAADAELLALKPDLYVDYGTVDKDYVAVVEAVQKRTTIPAIIMDGALERIPATYRKLGSAIGTRTRGQELAEATEHLLAKFRSALRMKGSSPRVYLACSNDVIIPCYSDERGGEVLEWLGGTNVAGSSAAAPLRPLTIEEIRKLDPQILVVHGGPEAAARLRANAEWGSIGAVKEGRVFGWPNLPYSWGSRPPSVNRLAGLIWLSAIGSGRPQVEVKDDLRNFFRDFYHHELTDAQFQALVSQ